MIHTLLPILLASSLTGPPPSPIHVVTSLTTFASIAREIVGDRAIVTAIAEGDEDPHFVQPRPSFVPLLRDADLFVTTGMDLELWVPALLDRAGNARCASAGAATSRGSRGSASSKCPPVCRAPRATSTWTGTRTPHRSDQRIIIARNILAGLQRVDRATASTTPNTSATSSCGCSRPPSATSW